jgi:hypothetical protein
MKNRVAIVWTLISSICSKILLTGIVCRTLVTQGKYLPGTIGRMTITTLRKGWIDSWPLRTGCKPSLAI